MLIKRADTGEQLIKKIEIEDLTIDFVMKSVTRGNTEIPLTAKEFALLTLPYWRRTEVR